MASEFLDIPEDIDDRIIDFVRGRRGVTVEMVLRDIIRIATIVKLVKEGWLDGENAVLCGGMAMRCLASPRFTIVDTDTSSLGGPDRYALARAIETDDDDLLVAPAGGADLQARQSAGEVGARRGGVDDDPLAGPAAGVRRARP